MQVLQVTTGQMLVLFSLILLGFILKKLNAIPDNTTMVLSKLENNLLVPALVLGTFAENFRVEKLSAAWQLFSVSFIICFVMMGLAVIVSKCCTKDRYIQKIYTYGLAFSNFGFMGNAVVSAVFPELFLEYLIFTMPLWTMIYLWGVPCLLIPAQEGKQTIKGRLKAFVNPMFGAMILGMLLGLCNVPVPAFATKVIDITGNCMSPVAMLLTGITIAQMDMKKVLPMGSIYVVSLVRLIVFPLLFLGLFSFVSLPDTLVICTVCSLAMPLGLSTIVIPGGYGQDTSVATGMTLVSHLLSVITIPGVFYLLMYIL
ncbi:MAG: AEC family transporter [Oscillospiraceae bacterium]|nr:AEC family transporter [Oscillospiraceae bacterium]